MKRIIYVFGFLLLIIVLSGCISIPLGDKVMEISTDGIEFIDDEEETDAEANEESEAESHENESASDEEDNGNAEAPEDDEETSEDAASDAGGCEEGDVSDLTDEMDVDFYIPDCSVLASISSNSNEVRASLKVTGSDWEEVHNDYKGFFGDQLDSDSKNLEGQSTELRAHLYDDESAYTRVQISQKEEHVEVHILHYFL